MELDDLKTAWQTLNATLARQNDLNLALLRERRLERARHLLRPLAWGQALQMAAGVLLALVSAAFWVRHRAVPHLLVTGLLLHAYGIALILFGARVRALIGRLNFGGPVLELQRRLAELRRFYGWGGLWIGLPWWVLWLPLVEMAFTGLFGADLYLHAGDTFLPLNLALGSLGWIATLVLAGWARRHPSLGPKFLRVLEGSSLTRAQRLLDELESFERE